MVYGRIESFKRIVDQLNPSYFWFWLQGNAISRARGIKGFVFDLQVGEVTIQTELAILPEERHKGLMHRDRLVPRECFSFLNKRSLTLDEKCTRNHWMVGYFFRLREFYWKFMRLNLLI